MADILVAPGPGIAAAGADRPKGGKSKTCDSITISRAGNGFIVEKMYSGGGGMEKPDVAPTLDEAMKLGMAALGGNAPDAVPPAAPAGPDAMAGAAEESGMPQMPAGPPPEEPGIRYDEGGAPPEPEDERY